MTTSIQMMQSLQPQSEYSEWRKKHAYSARSNQIPIESNIVIHDFIIDAQKPMTKAQLRNLFPNQHIIRIEGAYD